MNGVQNIRFKILIRVFDG